jgi:hypothetical protein
MTTPRKSANNEEPEFGAEESIPLDGTDSEGEEMMKDLGRDLERRKSGERPGVEGDPGPLPEQFPAS